MAAKRNTVSNAAMELALRLCEQPRPEIAGHMLRTYFSGSGDELIAAGALVEMALSETVFMPVDLDDQPVAFEWQPDREAHAAFHPTAGWLHANEDARRRYRLEFAWLLSGIARQLGIPAATRSAPLIPDLLWDLGDAWLHRRRRPILFARRIGLMGNLDCAERVLTAREGRSDGVLLTTSRGISCVVRLPGRHRVLHIRDCLDQSSRSFALDMDVLAGGRLEHQRDDASPVEIRSGGRWLRLHGREYRFRGSIQAAIVQQLYEAWRNGTPRQRTQKVLQNAGSSAKELSQAFSGRSDFKEIIGYNEGFCWMKVEQPTPDS